MAVIAVRVSVPAAWSTANVAMLSCPRLEPKAKRPFGCIATCAQWEMRFSLSVNMAVVACLAAVAAAQSSGRVETDAPASDSAPLDLSTRSGVTTEPSSLIRTANSPLGWKQKCRGLRNRVQSVSRPQ